MNRVFECKELVKTFRDANRELRILRGVNLDVYEGQVLAITGPSGVGKSTLLHLMGTLDRPTSGDILFRGTSISKLSRRSLNRIRNQEIGFVFQFYHLLPEFTALENVMMPALCKGTARAACRNRAAEMLAKVGLEDRVTHKPGKLSGGEQQRVAIARALFNRPAVVLTDEPTGNLDEHTGEGIIELLFHLNRSEGVTLVIVTHDDQIAPRAHRWVYLHEGLAHEKSAGQA
jgi:lipoprotein-releasing system ATP-binding protein